MADMSEFLNSVKLFQESVQQAAVAESIKNANENVNQIKQQFSNSFEQRQQLNGVAKDVISSLTAQGASPQAIQALMKAFVPPRPDSIDEALLSDDPEIQALGRQVQMDKAQIQEEAAVRASDRTLKRQQSLSQFNFQQTSPDEIFDLQTKFINQNLKPEKEQLEGAAGILTTLSQEKPGNAAFQMAIGQLLKASGDSRFSDFDIRRARVDNSYWANFERYIDEKFKGEPRAEDVEALKKMSIDLTKKIQDNVKRKAFGGVASPAIQKMLLRRGMNLDEFTQGVIQTLIPGETADSIMSWKSGQKSNAATPGRNNTQKNEGFDLKGAVRFYK